MSKRYLAFLVILNFVFIVIFLTTRVDQFTEGVYTLKLVGGCYLDYHVPIRSVGLACPCVDYIRLWPLPMVQPWPGPTDWPEGPGWLVESPPNEARFCIETVRIRIEGGLQASRMCDTMSAIKPAVAQGLVQ